MATAIPDPTPGATARKFTIRAVVIAIFAFCFDALYVGSISFTIFVLLYIVFFKLPKTLIFIRNQEKRKKNVTELAIYSALVVLVFGAAMLNTEVAKSRFDAMRFAIEQYHDAEGRYPETLDALAPVYVDTALKAKLCLSHYCDFMYYDNLEGRAPLFGYVAFPPFGRVFYDFEKKRVFTLD